MCVPKPGSLEVCPRCVSSDRGWLGGLYDDGDGAGAAARADLDAELSDAEQEAFSERWKVYCCSRTHSQLAQFVEELGNTRFRNLSVVTLLGSRNVMCEEGGG